MTLWLAGFIPGVVYGQDDDKNVVKTLVGVDQKMLAKELREKGTTFENTLYELVVDGEHGPMKVLVTPRQTQFNPGEVLLILFYLFVDSDCHSHRSSGISELLEV